MNYKENASLCQTRWPKDALRISFGIIWTIDALLKWQPAFRTNYMNYLIGAAKSQPTWLMWWFDFWIRLQEPHRIFFAYLAAVVETLIALALILGFARKLTYVAATIFSFLIWSTAEGFGGPYTAGSSDVGAAIIYVFVFLGLLALSYYTGTSRNSVDFYIARKVSWWWHIAEMSKKT